MNHSMEHGQPQERIKQPDTHPDASEATTETRHFRTNRLPDGSEVVLPRPEQFAIVNEAVRGDGAVWSLSAERKQAIHDQLENAQRLGGNEDSYFIDPASGTVVLADGVGGRPGGAMASHMTAQIVGRSLADISRVEDSSSFGFDHARAAIAEMEREHPELRGMSSTVVAGKIEGDTLRIGMAGDSMAGVRRANGSFQWLTFEQVEPGSGLLVNWIGSQYQGRAGPQADRFVVHPLQHGDRLLFATDGEIGKTPAQRRSAAWYADALNPERGDAAAVTDYLATQTGGDDDTTVLVMDIVRETPPEEPEPPLETPAGPVPGEAAADGPGPPGTSPGEPGGPGRRALLPAPRDGRGRDRETVAIGIGPGLEQETHNGAQRPAARAQPPVGGPGQPTLDVPGPETSPGGPSPSLSPPVPDGEPGAAERDDILNALADVRQELYTVNAQLQRTPWFLRHKRKDLKARYAELITKYQELWSQHLQHELRSLAAQGQTGQEALTRLKSISEDTANSDVTATKQRLVELGGGAARAMERFSRMSRGKRLAVMAGVGALAFTVGLAPTLLAGLTAGSIAGAAGMGSAVIVPTGRFVRQYAVGLSKMYGPSTQENIAAIDGDGNPVSFDDLIDRIQALPAYAMTRMQKESYKIRRRAAIGGMAAVATGAATGVVVHYGIETVHYGADLLHAIRSALGSLTGGGGGGAELGTATASPAPGVSSGPPASPMPPSPGPNVPAPGPSGQPTGPVPSPVPSAPGPGVPGGEQLSVLTANSPQVEQAFTIPYGGNLTTGFRQLGVAENRVDDILTAARSRLAGSIGRSALSGPPLYNQAGTSWWDLRVARQGLVPQQIRQVLLEEAQQYG